MVKVYKNETGFGAVEAVLVLVVMMIIGIVGFMTYHNHHKTKSTNSTPATTANPATKTATPTTTSTESATSFLIKEWGVKAVYTGQDTFTYTMGGNNIATVISKRLSAKDSGCATHGAGQIIRLLPTDGSGEGGGGPTVADNAKQNPGLYTFVGGYYYQFAHAQSGCGSVSINDQNQANNEVKALVKTFQIAPN